MNNHHLSIILKRGNRVEIFLKKNNDIVNRAFWQDKQDLDKKLLKGIDKILKESKIRINSVKTVKFSYEKETSFIAQQIGSATAEAILFAVKAK